MTPSSTNSTKRGKLLDLTLITSTEKGEVGIDFFFLGGGGGGGVAPGKGGYPNFLGGLQTQGEAMPLL